ncbi:hypothetical protein FX988_02677 [Paraglaciecola mesophila]|uniref:Uncharacterized protein n=1 Tax=Paraglaciecola mesophila TaxID=197222 RepID=A0A857JMV0_9ALTE|nr:hypothetical protein FX988_02677 [Paraglaciecola mesophila]
MHSLSMVTLLLTLRVWIRSLSGGVSVAFSALVDLSGYLTTSYWRQFFIALWLKNLRYRFAVSRLFFGILSITFDVGKPLLSLFPPILNRAYPNPSLCALSYNQFITLFYFPIFTAFSSVRTEPAAKRKSNSIATLKGNFYETYSRCRRRGGWS